MFLDPEVISGFQSQLGSDLYAFLPELILCGTVIFMLLVRLVPAFDRWHLGLEALTLTILALGISLVQWSTPQLVPRDLFAGMLAYDYFTIFLRIFLIGFASLTICLALLTGIPDREDSADFFTLLLGATLGMCLMASANHLLMVFIAIEMASVPSYVLAGFLKGKRESSEASLKYVVYGGGAAGIMLYGISLITGKFGTGYLPDLAQAIPLAVASGSVDMALLLGLLFIMVGFAFKLAAVPFHFWCPDVFEGAAAEVAGFLSVASKGAALALFARFFLVITGSDTEGTLTSYLVPTIAFFAIITATFGNLAAYPQTNLKRLLAYSTIAQAGYMMMGLATLSAAGAAAVLFYLIAYLFMNLGAFAIVAFLRNKTGSEDLSSFRGLVYRSPIMVVSLTIFLVSLLGIPPLAGFMAKFQIFRVLMDARHNYLAQGNPYLANIMFTLVIAIGVNTVISAVYYFKVLKVMILEKPIEAIEGKEPEPMTVGTGSAFYATIFSAIIIFIGILWNPLAVWSERGVAGFATKTAEVVQRND